MPKYRDLKTVLAAEIRQKHLSPGTRLEGVRELMARHGVSMATVTAALRELTSAGIVERRPGSGIYVLHAEPPEVLTVGLILTEGENPFLGRFLQQLTAAKDAHRVNLITKISSFDPGLEREQASELLAAGAKGLLLLCEPLFRNRGFFKALHKNGMPVVQVLRADPRGTLPWVVPDHHEAGTLAAKRLLASGCQNPVYIGSRRFRLADDRRDGFLKVLEASGIAPNRRRFVHLGDANTVEVGEASFLACQKQLRGLDGVAAFHDLYAAGVLRQCRRQGIAVPEDLKVVGCDNLDLAGALSPSLTSIDLGLDRLARESLDLLVRLVKGQPAGDSRRVIAPRLVPRESA